MKQFYTYILASRKKGTLYVGVTSDLQKRVFEHKENLIEGFTKKYNLHTLVYFEVHADIQEAIIREKQIKNWKRSWKIELIEKTNSEWRDLYSEII